MRWHVMNSLGQILAEGPQVLKQVRFADSELNAISKFEFTDTNVLTSHKTLVLNRASLLRLLRVTDAKLRQADRFIKNATVYARPKKRKSTNV